MSKVKERSNNTHPQSYAALEKCNLEDYMKCILKLTEKKHAT